ncbi:MAG: pyridoxal-phosphate dependent enzyme [Rhizobiaceae bacterium]
MNTTNVFKGPDALRNYLDPSKHPNLPMVEIPDELNPFAKDGVRIFAKVMGMSPLANVKAVPAFNMIREMFLRGDLEGVERLVENSSGNTVLSMALAARQFGVERTQSYIPSEISWNKLLMLLFFGIEPLVNVEPQSPTESDPATGVNKARVDGEALDAINPGQYDNPDNPAAHEKWTGPQIWEQTEGRLDIFCAGLGTTGTLIGNAKYLKSQDPSIRVVGVMRAPDQYVPGVRTEKLLNVVGFEWRDYVDELERIETVESYRKSMEMSRKGILSGPSSGLALAGLLQHIEKLKSANQLESIRKKNGEDIICVFPCPDGPMPYLDEYFKYLEPSDFPPIQNEAALVNKP